MASFPPVAQHLAYIKPLSGQYVRTCGPTGTALATSTGVANRIRIYPFRLPSPLTIDQVAVNVTTGVGSALVRVLIYKADQSTGAPDGLLYNSGDIDVSTNGVKTVTYSQTFNGGVIYWAGVWCSSTATLAAYSVTNMLPIFSNVVTTAATVIQRTVTFASAVPDPWGYVSGEDIASGGEAVFLRSV